MAVIDTSMDFPSNCGNCIRKHSCIHARWIHDKRDKNCPLKSTDEMIAEIDNLPSELSHDGRRLIRKIRVFDIIHKYCDKGAEQ